MIAVIRHESDNFTMLRLRGLYIEIVVEVLEFWDELMKLSRTDQRSYFSPKKIKEIHSVSSDEEKYPTTNETYTTALQRTLSADRSPFSSKLSDEVSATSTALWMGKL